MTNIRNETEDVTADPTVILKRTIRNYYEQLYTPKFYNLDKKFKFLEKYKLPQLMK